MPFLLLLFAFNLTEEIDKKIAVYTEMTNINKTILQNINEKKNDILDEFLIFQDLKDDKLVLSLKRLIDNYLTLSSEYQTHIDDFNQMVASYSSIKESQDKELLENINNLLDLSIEINSDFNSILGRLFNNFLFIEENIKEKKKDKLVRINSSLYLI